MEDVYLGKMIRIYCLGNTVFSLRGKRGLYDGLIFCKHLIEASFSVASVADCCGKEHVVD